MKINQSKIIGSIFFMTILCFPSCKDTPRDLVKGHIERVEPNIIFILANDQNYHTIAALGNAEISTPNLDKLVSEGISFTNAYIMSA